MQNETVIRVGGAFLHCYYGYHRANMGQRSSVCNGAGPRRFGWLIPDTFIGLCITESANIHDWCYQFGETIEDKKEADRVFRNNMQRQAEALRIEENLKGGWMFWREYKHKRRLEMIEDYYKAVDMCGGISFWDKCAVGFDWRNCGSNPAC